MPNLLLASAVKQIHHEEHEEKSGAPSACDNSLGSLCFVVNSPRG